MSDNICDLYPIYSYHRVRSLKGVFQVEDSWLVSIKGGRRYKLRAVPGTGCLIDKTEAFGADMQPLLQAESDKLRDATAVREAQEQKPPATEPQSPKAPVNEPGEADARLAHAIATDNPSYLDEGSFGGELDPYSPGANRPERTKPNGFIVTDPRWDSFEGYGEGKNGLGVQGSRPTPGPWDYFPAMNYEGFAIAPRGVLPTLAAVERGARLSTGNLSHVIHIECFNFPGSTEANAKLIAAAPELLDSCKALLQELRLIRAKDSKAVYDTTCRVNAQTLISRIEG